MSTELPRIVNPPFSALKVSVAAPAGDTELVARISNHNNRVDRLLDHWNSQPDEIDPLQVSVAELKKTREVNDQRRLSALQSAVRLGSDADELLHDVRAAWETSRSDSQVTEESVLQKAKNAFMQLGYSDDRRATGMASAAPVAVDERRKSDDALRRINDAATAIGLLDQSVATFRQALTRFVKDLTD